ncbi:hypothetical protein H6F96_15695 [Microcoleus sp. FACHB-53]|nr:hypothetical protein [Microcoleus sp. FACHB-53]MBD2127708.1 hypothetical protein [Microcoleus sp. FACHB-1]
MQDSLQVLRTHGADEQALSGDEFCQTLQGAIQGKSHPHIAYKVIFHR